MRVAHQPFWDCQQAVGRVISILFRRDWSQLTLSSMRITAAGQTFFWNWLLMMPADPHEKDFLQRMASLARLSWWRVHDVVSGPSPSSDQEVTGQVYNWRMLSLGKLGGMFWASVGCFAFIRPCGSQSSSFPSLLCQPWRKSSRSCWGSVVAAVKSKSGSSPWASWWAILTPHLGRPT